MMRLARIVRDASDLDGAVRSLPTPCNNAQASSNASQIVRVLLNSNASGVLTMTQPHTDALKPSVAWGVYIDRLREASMTEHSHDSHHGQVPRSSASSAARLSQYSVFALAARSTAQP